MHFVIKWRFLLKLAILLLIGGIALHFTHRWQVRRQVGAFLYQADQAKKLAEKEDKAGNEAGAQTERNREMYFLKRYVIARPNAIDVRDRLGRLIAESARTRKEREEALLILEDILRRDEDRDDLRQFTIDFAMSRGYFKAAKEHIDILLKKSPSNAELFAKHGGCLFAERNYAEAKKDFEESLRLKPDQISSYYDLAVVTRKLKKDADSVADKSIVDMLAHNKGNAQVYLLAWKYLRDYGLDRLPVYEDIKFPALTQEELVQESLKRDRKHLGGLLAAAEMAQLRGRKLALDAATRTKAPQAFQEARDYLARATQEHPKSFAPYIARAALEAAQGQPSDAIKVLQDGLTKLPDSAELSLRLMDYQLDAGDVPGATSTLEKLQARGLAPELRDYASARLLILQEKWLDAAKLLEHAIDQMKPAEFDKNEVKAQRATERIRESYLLLGQCHAEMGEHQRRHEAFSRALPLETKSLLAFRAMIGVAEAELALGRPDDALKIYRDLAINLPIKRPGLLIMVAKLELRRALASSSAKPDYSRVEEAIASAEKIAGDKATASIIPDLTEYELLRAAMENAKGQPENAQKILETLRDEKPKNVTVRIELAMQSALGAKLPEANAILDAAEKDLGDSLELRLARARLYAAAKEKDLAAKLLALAEKTEKFKAEEKRRLLRGLAEVASMAGADAAAGPLWDRLADAKPFDLSVQLIRFDRATRVRDFAAMERIIPRIEKIDGTNGHSTRLAQSVLAIQKSQTSNDRAPRDRALRELESIEREQGIAPAAGVLTAQGLAHDLNGDFRRAREKYWLAINRGELSASVIQRAAELFHNSQLPGDQEKALALVEKLKSTSELDANAQKLAAEVALQAGSRDKALEYATKAIPESSTNYKDQIWLGLIYAGVNNPNKPAVNRFRRATELAPDEMGAWLALVQHLAANKDTKDEAARTFERAKDKVKKADRAFFVALGWIKLGESAKAIDAFKQARTESPNDVRLMLAEADYLMQIGKMADARAGFEQVLKLDAASKEEKGFARQHLARAMAADPDYAISREALSKLPPVPSGNETPAERRTRAAILGMQKDRASKLEAIRLFEESKEDIGPIDKFMLAQLHAIVGNNRSVRDVMSDLLSTEKNQIPLYVQFYARWLIRHKLFDQAGKYVQMLDTIDPQSLSTAELKARLAMHRNDPVRARAVLLSKANEPNAPVGYIARVCEEIKLYDEAEQLFKKYIDENKGKRPEVVLAIAAYQGRRGRTLEGLKTCEAYLGKLPWPTIGQVVVGILYDAPEATSADMARAATWFEDAAKKAPAKERAALLQLLAAVRNLQGQYDASIQLYKDVLAANPRDALAMNNLAYLLSVHKKDHDTARGLIEQAKQIVGPINTLLDTEALIWLEMKQPEKAVKLLQDVVAEAPSGSGYFHLAQAELALLDKKRDKDKSEARSAWQRAKDLGLKPGDLHPLERAAFEAIENDLGR